MHLSYQHLTTTLLIEINRAQAFSVALLCLPLNTFFEDTFPGRQFGKGSVWRHISVIFGGATTFVLDATFRRHIVWSHISIISEAPPHLCLKPHFGAALFWRHIFTWRHIWTHIWRQAVFFHKILAFEMAPLTGRRLECMFWAAVIELARVVSTVTCC